VTSLSESSQGEVTSLSESSHGEVGDNREKWGDFWEKSIAPQIIDIWHWKSRFWLVISTALWQGSDFPFRELTWRSGRQQREVGRLLGEVN
jgi:hypothetical protein